MAAASVHHDLLLVDGYNLLHAAKLETGGPAARSGASRHRLLQTIEDAARSLADRVVVVFDSPQKFSVSEASPFHLEVVFASGRLTADGWIERKVAAAIDPSRVLVVTSDSQIRQTVRALGGNVMSARDFLHRCGPAGPAASRPVAAAVRKAARPLSAALAGLQVKEPPRQAVPEDPSRWWPALVEESALPRGKPPVPDIGSLTPEETAQAGLVTQILSRPSAFGALPEFRFDRLFRVAVVAAAPARAGVDPILAGVPELELAWLAPRFFTRWWKQTDAARQALSSPMPFSVLRIQLAERTAREEAGRLASYHQFGRSDRIWRLECELTRTSGAKVGEAHLFAWNGRHARCLFSPYETWKD